MKKTLIVIVSAIAIAAAALYLPKMGMLKNVNKELRSIKNQSYYATIGQPKYSKNFVVTRLGNLVVVKFDDYASGARYEFLRVQLSAFYLLNPQVKDTYINEAGTVVLDCRPR